jgi:hypothetical protein
VAGPPQLTPQEARKWQGAPRHLVTTADMTCYRVWGQASDRVGAWLTPTRPGSRGQARQQLALPPENSAEWISLVRVPAGTEILTGVAAPLEIEGSDYIQPGGGEQIQLLVYLDQQLFSDGEPLQEE